MENVKPQVLVHWTMYTAHYITEHTAHYYCYDVLGVCILQWTNEVKHSIYKFNFIQNQENQERNIIKDGKGFAWLGYYYMVVCLGARDILYFVRLYEIFYQSDDEI